MPERIDLTNQIPPPLPTTMEVVFFSMSKRDPTNPQVYVELKDNLGKSISKLYEGDIAKQIMNGLNKANLSTAGNSLEARIMKRLIQDNVVSGSVSGAPD